MPGRKINIAQILFQSETNGPGLRSVIWLQGCGKRCAGCFNQEFLPFGGGNELAAEELVMNVSDNTGQFRSIEGITFSGGEPFDQSEALLPAAKAFRNHGLTMMAFSGYTIGEIQRMNEESAELLGLLDILVDGEYNETLACSRLWRSSFNQTVHFLTERYRHYQADTEQHAQECEVILENNKLGITGFPGKIKGTTDLFYSSNNDR